MSSNQLLAGRRILVADDEPFNLTIVVRMMRALGAEAVIAASHGGQAMGALGDELTAPDFAILDFNMPEINGLDILKQVRTGATAMRRDLPILMLTGSSDFALVGAAMALDVDAFILKPVSQAGMATRLEKLMRVPNDCKAAEDYAKVDVATVGQKLGSHKPVGLTMTKVPTKKAMPQGVPARIDALRPGAVLAEDIRSPSGELLLGPATVLTDRLIRRLQELQSVLKIDQVQIFPAGGKTAE
jgi:CheY-like chemotaxis protein